jgi:hypothetical protein
MLHKERKTLVDMKLLMQQLRGDAPWVPAGDFIRPDDISLFLNEKQSDGTYAAPPLFPFENGTSTFDQTDSAVNGQDGEEPTLKLNGDSVQEGTTTQPNSNTETWDTPVIAAAEEEVNGIAKAVGGIETPKSTEVTPKQEDTTIDGTSIEVAKYLEPTEHPAGTDTNGDLPTKVNSEAVEMDHPAPDDGAADKPAPPAVTDGTYLNMAEISKSSNPPTPSAISSPGSSPPARMQTRAQTNAANGTPHLATLSNSGSPDPPRPESPVTLHPLYLPTSSALPDRNIGLPPNEAEDLRRLLSIYIQKQEEVCRGSDRLYQGLLKALRLQDTVWWWCRAEQHHGEMSDGEDWVDQEEWGLDEELRKGDAVTEENVEEQGKKTRGRRAAG